MAFSTMIKRYLNVLLKPMNIKIDSLTVENLEQERLSQFESVSGYDTPVYTLSPGMAEFNATLMSEAYDKFSDHIERLKDPTRNDTGYATGNNYFETPDIEALYLLVRYFRPAWVIEVGCGNSTKVTRQAIIDGDLDTRIIAIDPHPRVDISHLVDRFEHTRLETLQDMSLFDQLQANDIVFIDSSHELRVANDVAHFFCRILPSLPPGVIIHIHDIFLPFEYPRDIAVPYPSWGEQYILHSVLSGGQYEILWPGFYVQRMRHDLHKQVPFVSEGRAQSFWIRKVK